jgi:quinol monooxygenase YgiN
MAYGLFSTFVAADGASDKLAKHLLNAAVLLSDDPSCAHYIVGSCGEQEVSVFEVWQDEAAHDASLRRHDIGTMIETARPFIAGASSQTELKISGGKGLG